MMAHSMGALAGLRFLQQAPEIFRFAWLSSPLVKVGARRGPVVRMFTRIAAEIVPFLTIDSGVRPEDCRPIREGEEPDPLLHYRISVAWAAACLKLEAEIAADLSRLDPELKLLITHGANDIVCPPEFSRALFDSLQLAAKEYALIEGMMHEPFRGESRRVEVLARAGAWLDQLGFGI
jgi:alpha-beta hydrolase superfamily lysophospholipase